MFLRQPVMDGLSLPLLLRRRSRRRRVVSLCQMPRAFLLPHSRYNKLVMLIYNQMSLIHFYGVVLGLLVLHQINFTSLVF